MTQKLYFWARIPEKCKLTFTQKLECECSEQHLFVTAKILKQSLSMGERLHTPWDVHTTEYCSAIKEEHTVDRHENLHEAPGNYNTK